MSGVLSVAQNFLKEFFPKEKYTNAAGGMKLHYLIALSQPEDTIKGWIEKKPDYLNYRETAYLNLTPLAVCVLKGNKEIAQKLLEKGADPTLADYNGWTPFHHAVIVNTNGMLELLKTKNPNPTNLNNWKGTYLDLQQLISIKPADDKEEVFFLREAEKIEKCTALKFREITQSHYCKTVVVDPAQLLMSWRKPQKKEMFSLFLPGLLEAEYTRCMNNPPKLSLGKSSPNAKEGYDVFAEEDIPAFQGVTIYGGALETNPSNKDYLLDDIDGKKIRNLGPMINDGFPNCTCYPVMIRGFRYFLILSIRPIKAGEKLFWNYGLTHTLKFGAPHLELNREELLNYVSNKLLQDLQSLLQSSPIQIGVNNYVPMHERLKYLLETPATFLYLLSLTRFPMQEINVFLDNSTNIFNKLMIVTEKREILLQFIQMCGTIDYGLQVIKKDALEAVISDIRFLLFQWSLTLPMSLVMNCFAFFVNALLSEINSSEAWNEFKKDLSAYVSFMEGLHYYCSNDVTIEHSKFFPQIQDNFLKLTEKKKKEGLENLKMHLEGLEDKDERRSRLKVFINDLNK